MDMKSRTGLCEAFVIMEASSNVRVKAIVDWIEEKMEKHGQRLLHKEGYQDAVWVLLDYGDVVCHIFHKDMRKFYDLENLWGDAPKNFHHS